jgi:hypothetical protein
LDVIGYYISYLLESYQMFIGRSFAIRALCSGLMRASTVAASCEIRREGNLWAGAEA